MAHSGEKVERDALNAGDLVFFSRRGKRVDHVGIYLGNGRFVHAPSTGKDVMVSSLVDGYWIHKFLQVRRVTGSCSRTRGAESRKCAQAALVFYRSRGNRIWVATWRHGLRNALAKRHEPGFIGSQDDTLELQSLHRLS